MKIPLIKIFRQDLLQKRINYLQIQWLILSNIDSLSPLKTHLI